MQQQKADLGRLPTPLPVDFRLVGAASCTLSVLLILIASLAVGGCASSETPSQAGPDPTTDVFGRQRRPGQAAGGVDPSVSSAWAIVLGSFSPDRSEGSGQTYEAEAHTALFRAQAMAGLSGVSLERRGNGLVLLYGSFESGASPAAQRELAYVRMIEIGGARPYETAFLAPPGAAAGTMPDYDLATVKGRRGTKKPLYSLQVAVYGRPDNADPTPQDMASFRTSAEEAVARLRRDGEQAYYYHGPNRSMVTIGVFNEQEAGFASRFQGEGAALTMARQKFPHNLLNGEAVRERVGGAPARVQPSRLVEIPD